MCVEGDKRSKNTDNDCCSNKNQFLLLVFFQITQPFNLHHIVEMTCFRRGFVPSLILLEYYFMVAVNAEQYVQTLLCST